MKTTSAITLPREHLSARRRGLCFKPHKITDPHVLTYVNVKGDGTLPVPGWTGEYDWEGWVSFKDMPHSYNPERGYIMSANHKVRQYSRSWQ